MNAAHLLIELTVFVLAVFVGLEVISKVPATLHTPLMSATNAIHGIVLVGALLVGGVCASGLEGFGSRVRARMRLPGVRTRDGLLGAALLALLVARRSVVETLLAAGVIGVIAALAGAALPH